MNIKHAMVAALAVAVIGGGAIATATAVRAQEGGGDAPKPTRQERRDAFVGKVAANLGVGTDTLTKAFKDAALQSVDEALAAGRINEDRAAKLRDRINNSQGLGLGRLLAARHRAAERHAAVRGALIESAAGALNISAADLKAELKARKSVADVASDKGVSLDDVKAKITADAKAKLDQRVADGKTTQEHEDAALQQLASRLDDLLHKNRTP